MYFYFISQSTILHLALNKNKNLKVMKTTVKQLATVTFIAILFLVGNVKAEGTETNSLNREIIETPLELENWMTDENIWNFNDVNLAEFNQETEASLELEDWMINYATWKVNANEKESEPQLTVEPWMLDENVWK